MTLKGTLITLLFSSSSGLDLISDVIDWLIHLFLIWWWCVSCEWFNAAWVGHVYWSGSTPMFGMSKIMYIVRHWPHKSQWIHSLIPLSCLKWKYWKSNAMGTDMVSNGKPRSHSLPRNLFDMFFNWNRKVWLEKVQVSSLSSIFHPLWLCSMIGSSSSWSTSGGACVIAWKRSMECIDGQISIAVSHQCWTRASRCSIQSRSVLSTWSGSIPGSSFRLWMVVEIGWWRFDRSQEAVGFWFWAEDDATPGIE